MSNLVCEGCGYTFNPDHVGDCNTQVNLSDGSSREVQLCGNICADFWDESAPGDWESLDSGEEVQRKYWSCEVCDSVYEHDGVKQLVDTDDCDPEIGRDIYEIIVCVECQRKEPERFKPRAEVEGKA